MLKEPSKNHPNRRSSNWLIYKITDRFLNKYSDHYTGTLVDLGCGEGIYKKFFLQFCSKYVGVDWKDSLHNVNPDVVSDLNVRIDLPDKYADTIISISVMEHLYNPQQFLKECYRILKPGGYMILEVPWQWWLHEQPHDYFRYTPYGLKYLIEKSGFKIIEISPAYGFFTMWFLKLNYFTERLTLGKNPVKKLLKAILKPIWYINQKIAPYLDRKLDKNWHLETVSYWVLAQKVH